ncbi:MAG: adenylate kinase [Bacillota bacterium]|jgi:adenylate kinase|nr:adenylate kinase [Candidatus Fermentithermobacillaceae bacterium]
MRLVLLGAPGSGKGTQAKLLASEFGLMHVAPGDIFRAEIRSGTELGRLVESILARGELVDDATTVRVIDTRLSSEEAKHGFVLDGFPRTISQAEALDRILSGRGESLDLAVGLEVDEDAILRRALSRRVCGVCGKPYNIVMQPPKVAGKCDECGGDLTTRKDDLEETVRDRLAVYREFTEPLLAYYGEKGLLEVTDGEGQVDEVFQRVVEALRKRNLLE